MDELHNSQDLIEDILPDHESPEVLEPRETSDHESPEVLETREFDHESPEPLETQETQPHESLESLDDAELHHETTETIGDPETAFETESLESLETLALDDPQSLGFVDNWQPDEIPQLPEFNGTNFSEDDLGDDWQELDHGPDALPEITDSVYNEPNSAVPLVSSVTYEPTEFPRQFPGPGIRTMNTAWM